MSPGAEHRLEADHGLGNSRHGDSPPKGSWGREEWETDGETERWERERDEGEMRQRFRSRGRTDRD